MSEILSWHRIHQGRYVAEHKGITYLVRRDPMHLDKQHYCWMLWVGDDLKAVVRTMRSAKSHAEMQALAGSSD